MSSRINVLDINIDNLTAKEIMKRFVQYMQSEPVSVIEIVTADSLMQMEEVAGLKEKISSFDVIIAGDTTVLESAGITEKRYLREVEERMFLRMFLRYMCRNHKSIYFLVESEEEGKKVLGYLEDKRCAVQVCGMAKVSAADRADDMLVNAVNGAEVDCVISFLSSPLQEDFIAKNRDVLNTNVYLGLGKGVVSFIGASGTRQRFTQFIIKKIFQKEMEKRKKSEPEVLPTIK